MADIPSSKISVIVQGAVSGPGRDGPGTTLTCLRSVREQLPDAEIVLSTWQGAAVAGLPYDRLVENEDPGAVEFLEVPGVFNNVNRQIVTTLGGLRAAARPYGLKIRTDMLVTGTGFLSYFDGFPARSAWSIFRSKVVASTMFSRVPAGIPAWPYHPGDWFFFGETADLLDLWDIPLAPEPETTHWFVDRPRPLRDDLPNSMHRYEPEQYIWLSFLRKHFDVACAHRWDFNRDTVLGTERTLASNLILISPQQAGVHLVKYAPLVKPQALATTEGLKRLFAWLIYGAGSCYSHRGWRYLYERHCRGAVSLDAALSRVLQPFGVVARGLARWALESTEYIRHPERRAQAPLGARHRRPE